MRRLRPWLFLSRVSIREMEGGQDQWQSSKLIIRQATKTELMRSASSRPELMSEAFAKEALARIHTLVFREW